MRERIAKALYDYENPRGIRKWEDALPFVREEALSRADVVLRVLEECPAEEELCRS